MSAENYICVSQGPGSYGSFVNDGRKHVNILYNVFFDGTLNNKRNTEARLRNETAYKEHGKADSSYTNDFTNVALLYNFLDAKEGSNTDFDYHHKLYIEGIGTLDLQADKKIGYAFGVKSTGVDAKVNKAINTIVNDVRDIYDKNKQEVVVDEIKMNVFGFSRGATAARYFIYKTLYHDKDINESLIHKLKRKGVDVGLITFWFVGLFDTVSSVGVKGTIMEAGNVRDLKLDAIKHAAFTFHIAAADEYRNNFALTNIDSAGAKGKEVFLPGAHSDIGGGYVDHMHEHIQLFDAGPVLKYDVGKVHAYNGEIKNWIRLGWFRWTDIAHKSATRFLTEHDSLHDAINASGNIYVCRSGQNNNGISNKYSRIPLHIMKEMAIKYAMVFDDDINNRSECCLMPGFVPPILIQTKKLLDQYIKGASKPEDWSGVSPLLNQLRKDYFHFSSCYKSVAPFLVPNEPRYEGRFRIRKVFNG